MAKISTYPADSTPNLNDYLIGTDVDDANNTKTYTIGSIIGLANLPATYVPYTGATADVDLGSNNLTIGNNSFIFFPFSNSGISMPGGFSSIGTVGFLTAQNINGTNYSVGGYIDLSSAFSELRIGGSAGASGNVLISNGSGSSPSWGAVPGLTGYVPYTGATQSLNMGAWSILANNITATGSLASMGTLDLTGSTCAMSVNGSFGTAGQVLQTNGAGATPSWVTPSSLTNKGSFFHTASQTALGNNTQTPVRFNSSAITAVGVSISNDLAGNPTKINVTKSRVYKILLSCQLRNNTGSPHSAAFWLRLNGEDIAPGTVANTSTQISIQGSSNYVPFDRGWAISLNAGDYIQVMWATTDSANVTLYYEAANALHLSASPSSNLTIFEI